MSPQSCPLPDCLLNSPFLLPWLFIYSRHGTSLNILEWSTWIHQDLLYLDTSWSSFLEDSPPLWLEKFFSSSRFHLNCIVAKEDFPLVFISLLSWSLAVDPSSWLACTKVTIHYVCLSFLCICLLRCEGEFYSHCLPKVPGTQWMHNSCLFNKWMKTVKIMRNIQRAVSSGEHIMGRTQSEDGESQGQQILIVGGERGSSGRGCLPALLLQPAQTLRPWPGNIWLAHGNSKGRVSFCWSISHRILSVIASCPQVTPGSHLSDSLSYRLCPTLCPGMRGVFFISCFHILRLKPTSLHCWVACP